MTNDEHNLFDMIFTIILICIAGLVFLYGIACFAIKFDECISMTDSQTYASIHVGRHIVRKIK